MKSSVALHGLGLFLLALQGCGSPKTQVQSWWIEDAPALDGNSSDWSGSPLEYYIEKENVSLGVRNDSSDFYVLLRTSDERWARRISMFGLTLWLDREGKKGKTFGIRYGGSVALKESLDVRAGFRGRMGPEMDERMPMKGQMEPGTITVIHDGIEVSLPENNGFGPRAGSSYQSGFFSYEFEIPLSERDNVAYAIGVGIDESIDLGVELGGMDSETMSKMREEMEGMSPSGGMGGPPGGGMGGSPPGGGMGGPPSSPGGRTDMGPKEFWFKVTLAEGFIDL